jgi:sugar (pentulose or hexulose) kinase
VQPGARIGKISDGWGKSAGGSAPEVVAVCEHDTASAFLSAPLGADAIIISSGTWSLVGVEAAQPVINDYTFQHNIANEGGYPGHHRLLKNVMGLWLIQECRRFYGARGEDYSYEALVEAARQAAPFRFMINPDDVRFFAPGDMPEKIGDFCEENGQGKPEAVGDIIRCVLESLALQYRLVFEELETAAGRRFSQVNIVGGGSNNQLLNQLAANASGKTVLAGPDEATAIGNMLVQLISFGELDSVAQGRSLVRASFSMTEFKAEHTADWDVRYRDYLKMITARRKKNE